MDVEMLIFFLFEAEVLFKMKQKWFLKVLMKAKGGTGSAVFLPVSQPVQYRTIGTGLRF